MTDSLVTELINTKNENDSLSEEIKNKEELCNNYIFKYTHHFPIDNILIAENLDESN